MRIKLEDGFREIEILSRSHLVELYDVKLKDGLRKIEILSRSHPVELYNEELALSFFRRLLREPSNRQSLRRALAEEPSSAEIAGRSDEELMRELARRATSGDLCIVARHLFPAGSNATPPGSSAASTPRQDEAAAKEARASAAAAAGEEPAATVPGEETAEDPILANTDTVAQAQALKAAAASGAPLCET